MMDALTHELYRLVARLQEQAWSLHAAGDAKGAQIKADVAHDLARILDPEKD